MVFKPHIFIYPHDGSQWSATIHATSEADAIERMKSLSENGKYDGMLGGEVIAEGSEQVNVVALLEGGPCHEQTHIVPERVNILGFNVWNEHSGELQRHAYEAQYADLEDDSVHTVYKHIGVIDCGGKAVAK